MNQKQREMLQYAGTKVLTTCSKILYIFPVQKNKVIFTSYAGRQYSGSPKYLSEYLKQHYKKKFSIVWALRDKENGCKEDITVKFLSLRHYYHFITSKVIVDNIGMPTYMPKRKGQYVINTWHGGGAYKDSGATSLKKSKYRIKMDINKAKKTDLVLSSSGFFSDKVVPDIVYEYLGEIMPSGLPRNDVILRGDIVSIRQKICKELNIDYNTIIILYAPTFRGNLKIGGSISKMVFDFDIDINNVISAAKNKYKKNVTVLFRKHNALKIDYTLENVIDVSGYSDMQELLCAADILISDYSSTIWDFSLTKKPCFLYCPDLDYYMNDDRGVYTPIETWPGILCRSNEELERAILNFNEEEYIKKVEKHHKDLGSYENGTACEQVCKRIAEVCGVEKEE